MAGKNPFKASLIAPCGMDCAICMAFLREKNHCDGCNSPDRANYRKTIRDCKIFNCSGKKGKFCFTCAEFPCKRLRNLDTRYRTKYGMSPVENLAAIRERGIREFVRSERERWTCSACGGTVNVHKGRCEGCGKGRVIP